MAVPKPAVPTLHLILARIWLSGREAGSLLFECYLTNKNNMKKITSLFILLILSCSNVSAQNKVVVIPLEGKAAAPGIAEFVGGDQVVTLSSVADAVIRSVTINAPTDGVVIVNASGYFQANSEKPSCRCSITTGTIIDTNNLLVSDDISDAQRGPFAGTRGFNISAGLQTYNLVCDLFSGAAVLRDSQLTAMYFPD